MENKKGEVSWQFDPLQPEKPAELTYEGTVIATTSLKNAEELARKLNSQQDLYEALMEMLEYFRERGIAPLNRWREALAKAGSK